MTALDEELDAKVTAATARLDAAIAEERKSSIQPSGPGGAVTCPRCAHAAAYPGDAQREVLRCDQCGSRIAYGHLMPRIVNTPNAEDPRFIVVRVETVKDGHPVLIQLTLDRQLGGILARDLLSVCP